MILFFKNNFTASLVTISNNKDPCCHLTIDVWVNFRDLIKYVSKVDYADQEYINIYIVRLRIVLPLTFAQTYKLFSIQRKCSTKRHYINGVNDYFE